MDEQGNEQSNGHIPAKNVVIGTLLGDVRQCDVKWLQHEFWVKFRPSIMTPPFYEQMDALSIPDTVTGIRNVWGAEAMKYAVKTMLVEWGLLDENHLMVPIEDDTLDKLPLELLREIFNTCYDNFHPKAKSASGSKGS